MSRIETLRSLGTEATVVREYAVMEGVNAVPAAAQRILPLGSKKF
jgi:hypothetical protein